MTLDTDEGRKGCLDELQFVEFSGESSLDYVRSMNSYRRHLSPSQSAAIVLKHSEMLVLGDNQYNREGVQRCTPKSSKEVAKEAGVSKRNVDRTKKAIALEPEKVDDISEGTVTPTEIIKAHKAKSSTGLGGRCDKKAVVKMMSKILRQPVLNNHIADAAACAIAGTFLHKSL